MRTLLWTLWIGATLVATPASAGWLFHKHVTPVAPQHTHHYATKKSPHHYASAKPKTHHYASAKRKSPAHYAAAKPATAPVTKHHYAAHTHHAKHYASAKSHRGTMVMSADNGSMHAGPRPSRWCGWYMRTMFGGGPEYNLAANWAHRGRPCGPQVGAIVVWPHHVGVITGKAGDGKWIVKSGNDGHAVRERARSVAGATFRMLT